MRLSTSEHSHSEPGSGLLKSKSRNRFVIFDLHQKGLEEPLPRQSCERQIDQITKRGLSAFSLLHCIIEYSPTGLAGMQM